MYFIPHARPVLPLCYPSLRSKWFTILSCEQNPISWRAVQCCAQAFPFFKPNFAKMEEYGNDMGAEEVRHLALWTSRPLHASMGGHHASHSSLNPAPKTLKTPSAGEMAEMGDARLRRWSASCARGGRTSTSGRCSR